MTIRLEVSTFGSLYPNDKSNFNHFGVGCNINRDIPLIIEDNGFKMSKMETMYISGWIPTGYIFRGAAEIK